MTRDELAEALDAYYIGDGPDSPFRGYEYLGYIGSHERNYVTDAWVCEAAGRLGWGREHVIAWATSTYGRWAMDAEPMSAGEMFDEMRSADLDVRRWVAEGSYPAPPLRPVQ
jgi:hypothetical protein